jgi:uncharacterized protein (DUF983 family)
MRAALETFWAILRERCPRCRKGRVFRGTFAMNDPCPDCGLLFQREEGYFLGAMYISYGLSTAILTALYFTAAALLPNLGSSLIALVAIVPFLPFTPAVFRYSRVMWIYFDRWGDPDGHLSGHYEKMRLRKIDDAKAAPPPP